MELGGEKCNMLIMKSGKQLMTERIELPNLKKKTKKTELSDTY